MPTRNDLRTRKIQIKLLNEECVVLAGKVDCFHDRDPSDTSNVSDQFSEGANAAL